MAFLFKVIITMYGNMNLKCKLELTVTGVSTEVYKGPVQPETQIVFIPATGLNNCIL